jgi:hypothetical protein
MIVTHGESGKEILRHSFSDNTFPLSIAYPLEDGKIWIGGHHKLNHEAVQELVQRLENWLQSGSLKLEGE